MRRFLSTFSLILFFSGCTSQTWNGAMQPYSFAPKKSDLVWEGPTKRMRDVNVELPKLEELESHSNYTLGELLNVALVNNPETKISWNQARAVSAKYGQSLRNYFLQSDIDASWTREKTPNFEGFVIETQFDTTEIVGLDLSYLFLDFGQTRATSQAALYSLYYADWHHNRQIQTTIQSIMSDYYNFLYEEELLHAKEMDIKNAKLSLDAASERLRTGMGDIGDTMQATTSLMDAKLSASDQRKALHASYTRLMNDMGLPPTANLTLEGFPKELVRIRAPELDALVDEAKKLRPDYLAAIANVHSKEQLYKAAMTKHYPQVNGKFRIGKTWSGHGVQDDYDFRASVALSAPLVHGFFIFNQVRKAKATLAKAKDQLEQLELKIFQELSNTRANIGYNSDNLDFAKQYLDAAVVEFRIMLDKYRAGTATIVELINAQTSVSNSEARFIQAKQNWYISLANLAYNSGSLSLQSVEEGEKDEIY